MKRLQQGRGFSRYSLLLWFLITATGCASLQRQPLDVLLSDLELLPAQGLAPRFSISMQLINPNNSQIDIKGGSFRLYLGNSRVAAGVIEKPFLVPALGQSLIKAQCTGDLIGGASLFHKLMHSNAQAIEYQLEVTLHESNRFIPIRLQRDGVVNLSDI